MLDRHVRRLAPETSTEQEIRPFSAHLEARNLILLGDPGAGKTQLFKQSAHDSGGEYLTVRQFLATPVEFLPQDRPLWIDALDESRSGRSDRNTIDSIVSHLHALRPKAVRLSCRVADWLGNSDLAAFAPYFERHGGAAVVVHLQPLSEAEQRHILAQHGIEQRDDLVAEARRRGLHTLLANPQTLLMLARVVAGKQWPTTRKELFERAVDILLREHNDVHSERDAGSGRYTERELMPAAGALCALRLVSDCAGFTLRPNSSDADLPSYRDIDLEDTDVLRSALTRRIFVSTGLPDTVDYVHRTLAEYLGAVWIANRIQKGLPLGRVRALLGVDGQPASSLRGLHAWLAVLAPDASPTLIDADPMGIVMYADAAQLGAAGKKRLMTAISHQADRDPWFYRGAHAAYGIGALADPGMVETFREILRSASAPTMLKLLVVAAQTEGQASPELRDELQSILAEQNAALSLRDECLDALCAMGDTGAGAVCAAYPGLGDDESGLRLRCSAMRMLYGKGLGTGEFVDLVRAVVDAPHDLPIGAMFSLDRLVPDGDAPALLDRLDFTAQMPERGYSHRKSRDLVRVYEALLIKAMGQPVLPDAQRLYSWLNTLRRYSRSSALEGALKQKLADHPELAVALVDAWIDQLDASDHSRSEWYEFRRVYANCFNDAFLLGRLQAALTSGNPEKERIAYRLMLEISLSNAERFFEIFWLLHRYAEGNETLVALRDPYCVHAIHDWHLEHQQSLAQQQAEDAASRQQALADFDRNQTLIRSGEHLGWLGVIADHYFGDFDVDDKSADPVTRLMEFFGEERATIALEGLKALLDRRTMTPLLEIIAADLEGKLYDWWSAVIAGLDRLSDPATEIADLPDDYLMSAIAIACLHPVFRHAGNTIELWDHAWLQQAVSFRPDLACRTYAAIVDAGLAAGKQVPDGLQELEKNVFSGSMRAALLEGFLTRYPRMHHEVLERLLRIAWRDGSAPQLAEAVEAATAAISQESAPTSDLKDTHRLWLAFGFLIDADRYRARIDSLDGADAEAMVWLLMEMGSLDRHRDQDFGQYSTDQLEFVARYAAIHYSPMTPPSGIVHGRRNSWDASASLGIILEKLSANTDDAARAVLQRMADDPVMAEHATEVRHLLAEQQVRRVDAAHRPPDWRAAATTLAGSAPCSAEDLHALVLAHLQDACDYIANANTDPYKQFWNTDRYGRLKDPKQEELARDALVELLRPRLQQYGVRVEPEGHMARDKRADIVVSNAKHKCVIELKRDYHNEVWSAATTQLERLYTRDPEASGYGIFGVFWYGQQRSGVIPPAPAGHQRPTTPLGMRSILESTLPGHLLHRIAIVVIDVSGTSC